MQKYSNIHIFLLFFFFFSFLHAQNKITDLSNLSPIEKKIYEKQQANANFVSFQLFDFVEVKAVEGLGNYTHLRLNEAQLQVAFQSKAENIRLEIPINANENISLLLTQSQVLSEDFVLYEWKDENAKMPVSYQTGQHYYGTIAQSKSKSLAALSIFEAEIMAVLSFEGKNWILGAENQQTKGLDYILYNEQNFALPVRIECHNDKLPETSAETPSTASTNSTNVGGCVRVALEADYALYVMKSSNTTTVANYLSGLYNVVKTLYANESITTVLSEIYVWTKQDPYPHTTSNDALDAFTTRVQNNFNGNLVHLVSGGTPNLGGLAWLGILCYPYNANFNVGPTAFSNLQGTYQSYPTFSWDAEVLTHEMGHNLGSHHTHWCGWTGGALDNCYTTEGGCVAGPAPTSGGTIMSYCHLTSTGITLTNGFGPQPQADIQSKVVAAACVTTCTANCANILTLSTAISSTTAQKYEAVFQINATNTLSSGTNVTYDAGYEVVLQPGFIATTGSTFIARIDGCDGLRLIQNANNQQDNELGKPFSSHLQAFPNPTDGEMKVLFSLPKTEQISLEVRNQLGQLMLSPIENEMREMGEYTAEIQMKDWAAGIYYLQLKRGNEVAVLKVVKW